MHSVYIINGKVEFHPTTSTLRTLDAPEDTVILNSPAGRCFLFLIQRQGHIVSQHEMMDEVWVKSGIFVSANTYYQNISILRKGLKQIGFNDEIIVTIPRIGLTLASGISVEKKQTEHEPDAHHEEDFDEPALTHEDKSKRSEKIRLPDHRPTSTFSLANMAALPIQYIHSPLSWQALLHSLLITAGIIFFLLSGLQIYQHRTPESHYTNFFNAEQLGNCNVFLHPRPLSSQDQQTAMQFAKKFADSCDKLPYIYVDSNSLLPRVSVMRCPVPVSKSGICISDHFILDK